LRRSMGEDPNSDNYCRPTGRSCSAVGDEEVRAGVDDERAEQ
jgi:hypothetical protein